MAAASRGMVLTGKLLDSMVGLPLPLVVNRLVLVLSDALDELPAEKAVEIVARNICDIECRGCDYCDPEQCIGECMNPVAARLRRLIEKTMAARR